MQLIDHHLLRHSIGDLLDGVLDSHTRIGKYRSIGPIELYNRLPDLEVT